MSHVRHIWSITAHFLTKCRTFFSTFGQPNVEHVFGKFSFSMLTKTYCHLTKMCIKMKITACVSFIKVPLCTTEHKWYVEN